jgi:hypothetical protein
MKKIIKYLKILLNGWLGILVEISFVIFIFLFSLILNLIFYIILQ